MSNLLAQRLPRLALHAPVMPLAKLPTPLRRYELESGEAGRYTVLVKHDEHSGPLYGGNKVRKLEYLLQDAHQRGCRRIATYGAAGSNHALATALYARQAGFECTCLLGHQPVQPGIDRKLLLHQALGTEIVRFGGNRSRRVAIQRRALQQRDIALFPMGGSNWRGTLGFVNAALELAGQCAASGWPVPGRVYIASGTLGSAAGLALGFALAETDTTVCAVRVTDTAFANPAALDRLLCKTATLMRRFDPAVPADIARRARCVLRDDFFGEGYGRSNAAIDAAIAFAARAFGIGLDVTYSGKAMAALLHDQATEGFASAVFWNTANGLRLPVAEDATADFSRLPADFARYFNPEPATGI